MGSIRECQSIMTLEPEVFRASEAALCDQLAAATYLLIRRHPGLHP